MISHDLKCIFIHISRAGGKSIEKSIWGVNSRHGSADHKRISHWQKILEKERFDSYYKFTFCRNPWDRVVSLYYHYKQTVEDHKRKFLPRYVVDSFESFVNYLNTENRDIIAPTQLSWLEDLKGTPRVDFIGRFETYNRDWDIVCEKLKIKNELPHVNKSKHKNYKRYYNDELCEMVAEIYKDDVHFFDYKF